MTKVNKTMFGAGLRDDSDASEEELDTGDGFHFNITQTTLEQLAKVGLAKEIIQQGDGSEYELGAGGSTSVENRKAFPMLGKDISEDELRMAGIMGGGSGNRIPTMWDKQTIPVEEAPGYQKTFDVGNSFTKADGILENIIDNEITVSGAVEVIPTNTAQEKEVGNAEGDSENEVNTKTNSSTARDPIDMLTVARLKEILREQGLKSSGSKQILRDRLKIHVNSLLKEEGE